MKFEKVSFGAFIADVRKYIARDSIGVEEARYAWNNIKIPERKTKYSAGYDICTPFNIVIPPKCTITVPTGIRVVFNEDEIARWHLQTYVRSSVGIRDRVVLTNGTDVIDSDYQFADNEGDMMLALFNMSPNTVKYKAGDRICQAVFCYHGITENDNAEARRTGGIGSTNERQ